MIDNDSVRRTRTAGLVSGGVHLARVFKTVAEVEGGAFGGWMLFFFVLSSFQALGKN